MNNSEKAFNLKDKIGYMFGDLGNDFTFIFASSFLMIFYTNVLGINAALVGTLFIVARCIDAFTDVTMGRIVDFSKPTKNGKFRPWIKRIAGPVAIASFLMYQSSIAGASMSVKVVYMYITYILWGSIFYTAVNIPYGSMASAITENPNERASLSTFRGIGATLAGMFIGILTPLMIYTKDEAGNQIVRGGNSFTMVAGLFSILAIVCYIICYKLTTERVQMEKKINDKPFVESFFSIIKNRSLIGLIVTALATVSVQIVLGALNNYVFLDVYNDTSGLVILNSINPLISIFIISPLALQLSKKIGKKEVGAIGLIGGGIIFILMYIIRPASMMGYTIMYMIASIFALSLFNVVIWASIIDIIDDHEIKTGEREDGTVYAVYSFSRKIGQAIAGGLGGWILGAIGYVSSTTGETVIQTPEVKQGLFNSVTLIPAAGCIIAGLSLIFIYTLSKNKVNENNAILAEKRAKR